MTQELNLFVIVCRYGAAAELARHYEGHVAWVERHAGQGRFLLAGPMPSHEGGMILARVASRAELDEILSQDSFARAGLVRYEVLEFAPRRGQLRDISENPLFLDRAAREAAFGDGA